MKSMSLFDFVFLMSVKYGQNIFWTTTNSVCLQMFDDRTLREILYLGMLTIQSVCGISPQYKPLGMRREKLLKANYEILLRLCPHLFVSYEGACDDWIDGWKKFENIPPHMIQNGRKIILGLSDYKNQTDDAVRRMLQHLYENILTESSTDLYPLVIDMSKMNRTQITNQIDRILHAIYQSEFTPL